MKNIYLRIVKLNNRKSCPTCKLKLEENESIYSSGEYIRAKWRNLDYFCEFCFNELNEKLYKIFGAIEYKGYQGFKIPNWID